MDQHKFLELVVALCLEHQVDKAAEHQVDNLEKLTPVAVEELETEMAETVDLVL
tara:strand:- start:140 stop:301 length:162 start_codon:yes stop_codon:yes gene_type:complete